HVDADLGRGEPDPGRGVAGLDHVGKEGGEVRREGGGLEVLGQESGGPITKDVPDHRNRLSSRTRKISPRMDSAFPWIRGVRFISRLVRTHSSRLRKADPWHTDRSSSGTGEIRK